MQQTTKFGIYLNPGENQAVRINSPYWTPPEPDWIFLTAEVNARQQRFRRPRSIAQSFPSRIKIQKSLRCE